MTKKAKPGGLLALRCALLLLSAQVVMNAAEAFNVHASRTLRDAVLAASCSGCHEGAQSSQAIPSLHQRTATEIQAALLAFRSDRRQGTVMNKIAKGYTDAEIEILAEYLARNASGD